MNNLNPVDVNDETMLPFGPWLHAGVSMEGFHKTTRSNQAKRRSSLPSSSSTKKNQVPMKEPRIDSPTRKVADNHVTVNHEVANKETKYLTAVLTTPVMKVRDSILNDINMGTSVTDLRKVTKGRNITASTIASNVVNVNIHIIGGGLKLVDELDTVDPTSWPKRGRTGRKWTCVCPSSIESPIIDPMLKDTQGERKAISLTLSETKRLKNEGSHGNAIEFDERQTFEE